jgi:WD40 repeat protein
MTPPPIPNPRRVVPHASPAPVTSLAAAVVPAGAASPSGAVPQWYVLSSDGDTARCWPAGSSPGDVDCGPRYGKPPERLVLARLALARLDNGTDIVVASARPRIGHGEERALLRWDRESGQPIGDPVPFQAPRTHPAFRDPLVVAATSAGPVAATNATGGGVQLWDLATGQPAGGPLGREYGTVLALAAGTLADGSPVILSADVDSTVRRWDPASGTEIGEPIRRCGHAVALDITGLPDGRHVVTVLSGRGNVHRRDLLTGEPLAPKIITGWEPGKIIKVCMGLMAVVATDDGAVIATSTNPARRSVQLWDLVSGEPRGELRGPQPARVIALASARLPDGTPLLLTGDSHGSIHGFDARDGHPVGEPVQPHDMQAARVHPVTAPDGRLLLAVEGASTRLVDACTGEPVGGQWEIDSDVYATTVVLLTDGRIISASAHADGLTLHDARSGAFPPPHDFTLWDIAAATLPDGRVVIGGAGHDWLVYRWDAATGERIGEPLRGHRLSVKTIAVARQADGRPMFVTGCERGEVLRWDAATGEQIGPPLPGTRDRIGDLAAVDLLGGRQILVGLDGHDLYRWNPVTGESLGPPVYMARWATFIGIYVDRAGVPFGFVDIPDVDNGDPEGKHVERWRLDSATPVGPPLPATFRAVFDDDGVTWMVLAEPDGSLVVCPLPPIETEPGANPDGLW